MGGTGDGDGEPVGCLSGHRAGAARGPNKGDARKKRQKEADAKKEKCDLALQQALLTVLADEAAREEFCQKLEEAVRASALEGRTSLPPEEKKDDTALYQQAMQKGGVAIATECFESFNTNRLPNNTVIRRLLASNSNPNAMCGNCTGLYWLVKSAPGLIKGKKAEAKGKAAPKAKAKGKAEPGETGGADGGDATAGLVEAIQLLVDAKADVEQGDALGTPLWWAMHHRVMPVVEALVSAGALCAATDVEGEHALGDQLRKGEGVAGGLFEEALRYQSWKVSPNAATDSGVGFDGARDFQARGGAPRSSKGPSPRPRASAFVPKSVVEKLTT